MFLKKKSSFKFTKNILNLIMKEFSKNKQKIICYNFWISAKTPHIHCYWVHFADNCLKGFDFCL